MSTVLQADTGRHRCHFLVAVSIPRGQGERQRRTCRKVRAGGQGPRGSVPAGRAPRGPGDLAQGSGAGKWLFPSPLLPPSLFPTPHSPCLVWPRPQPRGAPGHRAQPQVRPQLHECHHPEGSCHHLRVPANILPSPVPEILCRLRLRLRKQTSGPLSLQHLIAPAVILNFCSLLLSVHCCDCTRSSAIQGTLSVPVPLQPDPAAAPTPSHSGGTQSPTASSGQQRGFETIPTFNENPFCCQ